MKFKHILLTTLLLSSFNQSRLCAHEGIGLVLRFVGLDLCYEFIQWIRNHEEYKVPRKKVEAWPFRLIKKSK